MLKSAFTASAALALIAFSGPMAAPESGRQEETPSTGGALPRHAPRMNRAKPLIAVLGYNPATEITDYVVPYGILAESGVAEVVALSTSPGTLQMSPALRFRAHATTAQFDARFPQGADYVIVPNIYEGRSDPGVLGWIGAQADRGAVIVGICDGVPVLANAGLLKGRRATGHWKTIPGLERKHPDTQWLRNRRYVADGNVITTSGVSASIPISIALVEAIAGRARAEALAQSLGATDWSARHDSAQFRLTAGAVGTNLANTLLFWRHENLGIPVAPMVDEMRVAVIADVYNRTGRSPAFTVAPSREPVKTRRGLTLLPDRALGDGRAPDRTLSLLEEWPPMQALDRSLEAIAGRYGRRTAAFVALTMEYEWNRPLRSNP
jgi:transcriptional regulator GlxA family with amidase domain